MNFKKMALGAVAALGMLTVPAKAPAQFDQGSIETIALVLLAEKLGLDPNLVSGLTGSTGGLMGGGSLFDLAPLLAVKQEVPNQSLGNLVALRNQGLSWDAIATRTKMSPNAYSRLKASGRLDNNNIWRQTALTELKLSDDTINRLRSMGFTWKDVVMTAIVSRESGRSLSQVANSYRQTRNWNKVAASFRMRGDLVTQRVTNWRKTRTVPTTWRNNSTGWATMRIVNTKNVPPGLAKKGGMPPGQAKKHGNKHKGKGHG